jgi:plasmid stability protein
MATALEFARKTAALPGAMREAEARAVAKAALQATNLIRAEIRAAAPGGTIRLNGKPKRIGVSYKMVSGGGAAKARISAQGPLHLLERDTASHYEPRASQSSLLRYKVSKKTGRTTVVRRTGRARGRLAPKPLAIPGIGFRTRVVHPGTKGKHPFAKGLQQARPVVGRTIMAEVSKGLRAALR